MVYSVCNSEVGGRTLFRLLAKDAGGETEEQLLKETVPPWVLNVIVFVSIQECGASVLWYGTEIIIIIMKIIYIAPNPLKGSRRFTKSVTATLQFT